MITKCPNCNGALEYDVISDRMVCAHCLSSFMVGELQTAEEKNEAITEASQNNGVTQENIADEDTMECNIYTCTACGAELMINDVESSTYCAYCSQPTIVFDRVSMHRRPKLIIPFTITKEHALNIIRSKMKKGMFIPDEIKNFKVDILRGIYVPYWLVDLEYKDAMIIRGTVKRGKSSVTRYFYRSAESRFKNIPIDASKKFNDRSSERLEPFYYKECRDFNAQYLSGFYSDCSDEEQGAVDLKAISRAKEMFDCEVIKSVNASSKRIEKNMPVPRIESKTYALVPVWFLVFRYIGIPYTVMVNGQTGKMVGALPFDKKKVISFFAIYAVMLSALSYIILDSIFKNSWEDLSDLLSIIIVAAISCLSFAITSFNRYKKSIQLTMESNIKQYVSNRQEGM